MKLYNKNELLNSLNNGLDLTDEEYQVLINNGRYELNVKLALVSSEFYLPTLIEYTTLGLLVSKIDYEEDIDKVIPHSCGYMLGSLKTNKNNYLQGLEDSKTASSRLCRFNTVNFIRELAEIKRYEHLIKNLHDSITEIVDYGFVSSTIDELDERVNDLEESNNKIKLYRKKYIK